MGTKDYMKEPITEIRVLNELRSLGIKNGDVILITADLLNVGLTAKSRKNLQEIWINIFKELVGEEGTIVIVAYTKSFFRFAKNTNICFDRFSASTSGSLTNAYLTRPSTYRSTHPTNSILASGKYAEFICDRHTKNSLTYSFTEDIAKLNGKHLMLGTIDKKNAPIGFHYAQELIGETKFTPGVAFFQTYYLDEFGERRLFTRWDAGGCSGAGYKLIGHHLLKRAIKFGVVGDTYSAIIDVKRSIEVCKDVLVSSRAEIVCDDKYCLTCRGRWSTSGPSVFYFYFYFFFKRTFPILRKIFTVMRAHR